MLKRGLWRESAVATTAGGSAVFTWTAVLRRGILIGDLLSTAVVVTAADKVASDAVSAVEVLTVRLRADVFAGKGVEGKKSDSAGAGAGVAAVAEASGVLFPADRERVVDSRRVRVGALVFFPDDDFFDFIKFGFSWNDSWHHRHRQITAGQSGVQR